MKSLTLVGSSHLRNTADYFGVTIQRLNGKKEPYHHATGWKGTTFDNLTFVWSNYAYHAANRLLSLIQDTKNSKDIKTSKDVVAFMSGAWDLQFKTLDLYINTSTPPLFQAVKKLRSSAIWKNCRLIWINNIAYPEVHFEKRNNFIIQAANEHVRAGLHGLAVEEFDSFGISNPRNNQVVDKNHYIVPIKRSSYFVGDVGKEIAHELIDHICPT